MIVKTEEEIGKISKFLLKDPYLHLYEFAHINTGLSKSTKWFSAEENGNIRALALIYQNKDFNLLHFCEDRDKEAGAFLAKKIIDFIPDTIYGHVSDYIADIISEKFAIKSRVHMIKMKLTGDLLIDKNIKYPDYTYKANIKDFETLNEFLKSVNHQAFFNQAMLDTGKYYIIRKNNELISMAGVHFFNREFKVAAVGNVVTAEKYRGKGFAGSVTASLCRDLWGEAEIIGLHVKEDNLPAIKAYEKMGFLIHYRHVEIEAKR